MILTPRSPRALQWEADGSVFWYLSQGEWGQKSSWSSNPKEWFFASPFDPLSIPSPFPSSPTVEKIWMSFNKRTFPETYAPADQLQPDVRRAGSPRSALTHLHTWWVACKGFRVWDKGGNGVQIRFNHQATQRGRGHKLLERVRKRDIQIDISIFRIPVWLSEKLKAQPCI